MPIVRLLASDNDHTDQVPLLITVTRRSYRDCCGGCGSSDAASRAGGQHKPGARPFGPGISPPAGARLPRLLRPANRTRREASGSSTGGRGRDRASSALDRASRPRRRRPRRRRRELRSSTRVAPGSNRRDLLLGRTDDVRADRKTVNTLARARIANTNITSLAATTFRHVNCTELYDRELVQST